MYISGGERKKVLVVPYCSTCKVLNMSESTVGKVCDQKIGINAPKNYVYLLQHFLLCEHIHPGGSTKIPLPPKRKP